MKARRVKHLHPDTPLADALARTITTRADEVFDFMPRAADPKHVEALHDMRIAAKRLRYVLEIAGDDAFGPYATTAGKRAKELQDLLGEIHDCDVTLPRVRALIAELDAADAAAVLDAAAGAEDLDPALVARAPHAGDYAGLHALATHLTARRALLFGHFATMWDDLQRQGFRARLDYALGERP